MKKLLIALVFLTVLVGCENDVKQTSNTDNPQVQVGLLFTYEGCKVYRFLDGDYHYYTVCDKEQVTTSSVKTHYNPATRTMWTTREEISTSNLSN